VDVVRVSRKPDHVCGGVGGELRVLAGSKSDRTYWSYERRGGLIFDP